VSTRMTDRPWSVTVEHHGTKSIPSSGSHQQSCPVTGPVMVLSANASHSLLISLLVALRYLHQRRDAACKTDLNEWSRFINVQIVESVDPRTPVPDITL